MHLYFNMDSNSNVELGNIIDHFNKEIDNEINLAQKKRRKIKKPLLQYAGGKYYMRDWIINNIPKHVRFIEVFGGGASLSCFKKPSKIEVYNDINDHLVNFFRFVRNKPQELFKELFFMPHSRTEYYHLREKIKNDDFKTELEKAVAFFYVNRNSFSGIQKNAIFSIPGRTDRSKLKPFQKKIKDLFVFSKRMKDWIIENRDFEIIIDKYDTENTFFYCDPPYYKVDVGYYKDFTAEDHVRLAKRLNSSEFKGKFMLSYNNNEKIRELYSQHFIKEKKYRTYLNYVKQVKNRQFRIELLIMNYDINKLDRFNKKNRNLMNFI